MKASARAISRPCSNRSSSTRSAAASSRRPKSMPEPPEAVPPDSLAVIAIVYSMPEAAVLVATLNAYGIFALPRNRWHISFQPPWVVALGGIWIAVPRNQKEDALALLEEIDMGWRPPPRPFTDNAWLSGLYGWLKAEALPSAAPVE